jgi:hypothetical protein
MGVGIWPGSQRMVIANMVYQSLLCRRSVAPKQRFENFAMLPYCLNDRVAIQTLIVEEDIVIRVQVPGRVTQGGCPPRVPTEPDLHVKCIRLVTLGNRCPSHD